MSDSAITANKDMAKSLAEKYHLSTEVKPVPCVIPPAVRGAMLRSIHPTEYACSCMKCLINFMRTGSPFLQYEPIIALREAIYLCYTECTKVNAANLCERINQTYDYYATSIVTDLAKQRMESTDGTIFISGFIDHPELFNFLSQLRLLGKCYVFLWKKINASFPPMTEHTTFVEYEKKAAKPLPSTPIVKQQHVTHPPELVKKGFKLPQDPLETLYQQMLKEPTSECTPLKAMNRVDIEDEELPPTPPPKKKNKNKSKTSN